MRNHTNVSSQTEIVTIAYEPARDRNGSRAHLRRPTCLFHPRHRGQFTRKEAEHDDIPSGNGQENAAPRRRSGPRSGAGIREPHHFGN
jgi:hypothetical protein